MSRYRNTLPGTEILLKLSSKPVDTGKPTCVVKSMNHISLVNIGEVFLLKYLDVQILFSWKYFYILIII
jgi:hypothetical protein